ncbi:MAG: type II toxin-antitoxin system Phd/YefM family antitoxin [Magnetococcus sp. DMHC-8]
MNISSFIVTSNELSRRYVPQHHLAIALPYQTGHVFLLWVGHRVTLDDASKHAAGGSMSVLSETIPVSNPLHDAVAAVNQLQHAPVPIVITQQGRATDVLMSIESYERDEKDRALLQRLARGEQEIQNGLGHPLEDVFAEVDAILEE